MQIEPMGPRRIQSVLAVNHDSREAVLGTVTSAKRYPWSAITSVEVVKNGHAVSSVDRSSQLVGAALGGVLAGEAGMIAGGLSGRSTTRERVCEMALKVVVDDREAPVHQIVFLNLRSGVFTEAPEYQRVSHLIDHFHALIVNAMRAEQRVQVGAPQGISQTASGELERLWRLKELGALTDSEFLLQKGAILKAATAPVHLN